MCSRREDNRILWLDCLRVFTCFFVVFAHTAAHAFAARIPGTFDWNVCNCYVAMFCWINHGFFLISGVLFLDPEIEIPTDILYKKYIKKLALVFLFWFALNSIFFYWYNRQYLVPSSMLGTLKNIFWVNPLHLWFLLAMIGFYVSVPIIRCITCNKKILPYFVFVGIVAMIVCNIMLSPAKNLHRYLVAPVLPFVLGYYLAKCKKISGKAECALYILGLAGYLTMVWVTADCSFKEGQTIIRYFDEARLAMAVAVFCFFKCHVAKINFSHKAKLMIQFLSYHTLGIYLVHLACLCVIHRYVLSIRYTNLLISIPVVATITFLISLTITALLKKIPWFNRYFI